MSPKYTIIVFDFEYYKQNKFQRYTELEMNIFISGDSLYLRDFGENCFHPLLKYTNVVLTDVAGTIGISWFYKSL